MQYQKMRQDEEILEEGDLRKLKKHTEKKIRWVQQVKKLRQLPKDYRELMGHRHVQIDLSYNSSLEREVTFTQLLELKAVLKGLGYSKNKTGVLPAQLFELSELEELEWRSNGLKRIPDDILKLHKLQHINLRHNSLRSFPTVLLQLKGLKSLSLRYNKFKKLPDEIGNLTELEYLDLSGCDLSTLPETIGNLKKLKVLELEENQLQELPSSIASLPALKSISLIKNPGIDLTHYINWMAGNPSIESLNLGGIGLTALPENIGVLPHIKKINLAHSTISSFPESFKRLKNLEEIYLYDSPCLEPANFFETMAALPKMNSYDHSSVFPQLTEIPEVVLKWIHLEAVSIYNCPKFTALPAAFGSLPSLKTLMLGGSGIEEIPAFIKKIPLEALSIVGNEQLKNIPDFIYQMPLRRLVISNNRAAADIDAIAGMESLEEVIISPLHQEEWDKLSSIPSLKRVNWSLNTGITRLPEGLYHHKNLLRIRLSGLGLIPEDELLRCISSWQKVEHIDLDYSSPITLDKMIEAVGKLEHLKELSFAVPQQDIPDTISQLKRLEKVTIHFNHHYDAPKDFYIASQFCELDFNHVHFNFHSAKFIRALHAAKLLQEKGIKDQQRLYFLFQMLSGNFNALHQMLENPLNRQAFAEKVYIFGRPAFLKKTEIQARLKEKGAKLVKEPKEASCILLCTNYNEEEIEAFAELENVRWILEDHLREEVIAEEAPFLMQEGNQELNAQITRFLLSGEAENIPLLLSMMEGGGVTQKTASYVVAILHHHLDPQIRKQARGIYKKFISSSLQDHLKQFWKESFRNKDLDKFHKVIRHNELDFLAYILAYKMVVRANLASSGQLSEHYENYTHRTLRIRDFSLADLRESLKDFDFITRVYLEANENIPPMELYEHLGHYPLKELSLNYVFQEFPYRFLQISSLEQLSLNGQSSSQSSFILQDVPQGSILKRLSISNISIEGGLEALGELRNLQELDLQRIGISETAFLKNLNQLKDLRLNGNQLTSFPAELAEFKELRHLYLQHHSIEEVAFDFALLPQLQQLNLSYGPLKFLSDTFASAERLAEVGLAENQLTNLPVSLLAPRPKGMYAGLSIDANRNNISSIARNSSGKSYAEKGGILGFLGKKLTAASIPVAEKLNKINLSGNKFRTIPDILYQVEEIDRLLLKNNLIEELPANLMGLGARELEITVDRAVFRPEFLQHPHLNSLHLSSDFIELPEEQEIAEHAKYQFYIQARENRELNDRYQAFNQLIRSKYKDE